MIKSEIKVGQKVHYIPYEGCNPSKYENGIVKEIPERTPGDPYAESVRVVYNCAEDWDNYQFYTSALTALTDLKDGWYIPVDLPIIVPDDLVDLLVAEQETAKAIKDRATTFIPVLDENVYVSSTCDTILRIGHTSKLLEASLDFLYLPTIHQEFAVKSTMNLLLPVTLTISFTEADKPPFDIERYSQADKIALEFMMQKYPEKNLVFWVELFKGVVGKAMVTELNIERIKNLITNYQKFRDNLPYKKDE
jgi:hypothetical protein